MNLVDRTYDRIYRGMSDNRPPSIPTGHYKYDRDIYGIRQGQYILLGGETGTGKSKFTRSTYIHNVYEHFKRINNTDVFDVEFKDFSLELTGEEIMLDAISRKVFKDTGKIFSQADLESKGDVRLSQASREIVDQYKPYFYEFNKRLSVIDTAATEKVFHDVMMEAALSNGTFSTAANHISKCGVWTPHNPNKFVIALFDTLNIADPEYSEAAKAVMDRISRVAVWFKNKCNFTFVVVQQFNSDISDFQRGRFGIETPILRDFMDSTRPTKDCTVAIGLYSPMRHFKPDKMHFRGYDILKLGEWLVSLHVLKHRHGRANAFIPLKFDGALGLFKDLPPADDMTEEDYVAATSH